MAFIEVVTLCWRNFSCRWTILSLTCVDEISRCRSLLALIMKGWTHSLATGSHVYSLQMNPLVPFMTRSSNLSVTSSNSTLSMDLQLEWKQHWHVTRLTQKENNHKFWTSCKQFLLATSSIHEITYWNEFELAYDEGELTARRGSGAVNARKTLTRAGALRTRSLQRESITESQ